MKKILLLLIFFLSEINGMGSGRNTELPSSPNNSAVPEVKLSLFSEMIKGNVPIDPERLQNSIELYLVRCAYMDMKFHIFTLLESKMGIFPFEDCVKMIGLLKDQNCYKGQGVSLVIKLLADSMKSKNQKIKSLVEEDEKISENFDSIYSKIIASEETCFEEFKEQMNKLCISKSSAFHLERLIQNRDIFFISDCFFNLTSGRKVDFADIHRCYSTGLFYITERCRFEVAKLSAECCHAGVNFYDVLYIRFKYKEFRYKEFMQDSSGLDFSDWLVQQEKSNWLVQQGKSEVESVLNQRLFIMQVTQYILIQLQLTTIQDMNRTLKNCNAGIMRLLNSILSEACTASNPQDTNVGSPLKRSPHIVFSKHIAKEIAPNPQDLNPQASNICAFRRSTPIDFTKYIDDDEDDV